LSQAELAAVLGVSRQTANNVETGRVLPSLPLALAVARYFGTPVESIFLDDEPHERQVRGRTNRDVPHHAK
jgi:putative transcriptional regulator